MKFLKGIGYTIAGLIGLFVCAMIGGLFTLLISISGFVWAGLGLILFVAFGFWDRKNTKKPP